MLRKAPVGLVALPVTDSEALCLAMAALAGGTATMRRKGRKVPLGTIR